MYDDEVMDDPKASAKLFEEFYRNFQKHSKNIGLRESVRKKSLIKVLFFAKEYLSAEEVAFRIRESYQIKISLPSVYKILSTLEAINIVTIFLTYPGKTKKYKLTSMLHYDHLMCTKCGKVIQFHSEEIEKKTSRSVGKIQLHRAWAYDGVVWFVSGVPRCTRYVLKAISKDELD